MAAADDMFRKALALHQRGAVAAAQALYAQVLAAQPGHADSLHLMGLTFVQGGQPQKGVELIARALALKPGFAEAHYNLGHALLTMGRPAEALASFTAALAIMPNDAHCHLEAGNALKDLKREAEAVAAYDAALRLDPRLAEAHNNRGIALKDMDRLDDALASYDAAIRLKPDYAEAHSNRGNALKELGEFEAALACHDRALALKPDYAEAHYNRANVLGDLKRGDAALASYDAAIALRPDYAEAQHNKSQLLLALGRFEEGFGLYHWRWRSPGFTGGTPPASPPAWDGGAAEHVLLWGEQGIGDEIFHASLLSLLPADQRVSLAADPRLHAICRRAFPQLAVIDPAAMESAGATAQAAMGDLGALLRVDAGKIASRRMPFLIADAARRDGLRRENGFLRQRPVCGVSWKSANKRFGAEKSLRLMDLAPLLTTPGITFVNLQYGAVDDEIAELRDRLGVTLHQATGLDVFNDIDGLLALVDACDAVLTTSNVTAHLAGALAKQAVVVVPSGKGCLWYWQGGPNNLWYPSLRRVAQDRAGQWDAAVAAAAAAVKEFL